MNLNQLKYIIAIAEEKCITKAADRLHISQPSLSQSLQSLEKQIGTQLFDRNINPFQLSEAGKLYVEWARQVLYSEIQILNQIDDLVKRQTSRLIVGTAPHRAFYLFPPIIKEFQNACPNCCVTIEEWPTKELFKMLEDGKVDIVFDVPHTDTLKFKSIPIAEEKLLMAVSSKYNLPVKSNGPYPPLDLMDLKDIPFILLTEDMLLGNISRQLCFKAGFIPKIFIECRNVKTAHSLVGHGIGATFVYELMVKLNGQLPNIKYYSINNQSSYRIMAAVYKNDQYLSNTAKYFISLVVNTLQ